ncbi:hypothetical protein IAT38_003499 [Cryptococcus sp. DSM 104549]
MDSAGRVTPVTHNYTPSSRPAGGVNSSALNGYGKEGPAPSGSSAPTPAYGYASTPTNASASSRPSPAPTSGNPPPPFRPSAPTPSNNTPATPSVFPGHVDAQQGSSTGWERQLQGKKRKWGLMGFAPDEQDMIAQQCTNLQLALMMDQAATLYPPPPTAFTSFEDAVERLLPYHVWQVHDEELDNWEKADVEKEMKEAQELAGKVRGLKERFRRARIREDNHPSPLPETVSLLTSSTAQVREDLSATQSILRNARIEANAIEAEQRRQAEERSKEKFEEDARRAVAVMAMQAAAQPSHPASRPAALPSYSTASSHTLVPLPGAQVYGQSPAQPGQHALTAGSPVKRGRGRPPGRGRGGATMHTTGAMHGVASTGAGVVGPGSGASTPTGTMTPARPGTPGAAGGTPGGVNGIAAGGQGMGGGSGTRTPVGSGTPTPGTPGVGAAAAVASPSGPVAITVNLSLIPQLVALGLIVVPPSANAPRTPGIVVRTMEDKKSVVLSINLSACSKAQLLGLAKVLNVSTAKPLGSAVAGAGPSK